ncbi:MULTISPECIES: hypothetical protein [unclassified Nocardia]|uniref:hypothetical protein n=1 Tax=unclassified Nocardia TaxID=2637762 RepID=UPI00343D664C
MTRVATLTESTLSGRPFLPATLDIALRCPARSDYIELRFATSAGSWQWCFPEPQHRYADPSAATSIALAFGRYGAQAHLIRAGGLGPALPSSAALPLILADARILVERRLITPGLSAAPAKGPAA